MVDPERFLSAMDIKGGCGGRRDGAYVFDGCRAGAVGRCGLLDGTPFGTKFPSGLP